MLDLIHPASNDILLLIYRGGPKDENEGAAVRRNALTLAESGNLLMMPGRTRDQVEWMKDVRMLVDAGTSAFLKAAGSGVALTVIGGETVFLAAAAPPALVTPMTKEKAAFIINGKLHAVEYEARTTLWEVIAIQLGLVGTNRSCNRASCGACSVLVDGTALYSCHTLATEAVGKKILTIEGVGDEKNLHTLQSVGHTRMAADCGFCTAGWVVTAKGLLDKDLNPSEDEVKAVQPLVKSFG